MQEKPGGQIQAVPHQGLTGHLEHQEMGTQHQHYQEKEKKQNEKKESIF